MIILGKYYVNDKGTEFSCIDVFNTLGFCKDLFDIFVNKTLRERGRKEFVEILRMFFTGLLIDKCIGDDLPVVCRRTLLLDFLD